MQSLFIQALIWYLGVICLPFTTHAQIRPMAATPETRAVVVGIAEYADPRIPALQYSHKDAAYFADWLRSPAGGGIPPEHIRLLTNEAATNGGMVAAFTWLMETSRKDDLAIIYFSGHGDMENQTMMNHGFLLAHDAPAANYMAGGFSIMFLQSIIRTLSTQNQARVIVITDACRAGALAGEDFQGTQATAKVLADQYANEAKILSCQPNEFSLEGPQWGGGHGVFTWYLVDGLTGLADRNEDLEVTLFELQRFLEDHVPPAVAPKSQIPIVTGNKSMVISQVDPEALEALRLRRSTELVNGSGQPVNTKGIPSVNTDTDSLILRLHDRFRQALQERQLLEPPDESAYDVYLRIRDHELMAPHRLEMRLSLATALQAEAQKAINDYMAANPSELRRRWDYDPIYILYPDYLAKAGEVLGDDHFQYRDLMAKTAYFRGLNLRLQGEREQNPDLYTEARTYQEEALMYDSLATYALNELGLLARRDRQWEASIHYFRQVLDYAPTWVLARSNLCGSLMEAGQLEESILQCSQALRRDSTFALAHYNLGLAYQSGRMPDSAIHHFRQSVRYDSAYIHAYLALDEALWESGMYKEAQAIWNTDHDMLFDKMHDPEWIPAIMNMARRRIAADALTEALPFFELLLDQHPEYAPALALYGGVLVNLGESDKGQAVMEQAMKKDPQNEDLLFNMGFMHVLEGKYPEALPYFHQLIEIRDTHESAWMGIALCQSHMGKPDKASLALEKALQSGYKDLAFLTDAPLAAPLRKLDSFQRLLDQYLTPKGP